MKRWMLTCGLMLVVPAATLAQTAKIQAEIEKDLHQTRVYQDIEIMRRIVLRRVTAFMKSCHTCHATTPSERAATPGDPTAAAAEYFASSLDRGAANSGGGRTTWANLARPVGGDEIVIDGHYVKGQGVVLQAQLPSWLATMTREAPGARVKKPAPAVNEWDTIRRQLWGEKVEAAVPPDDPHLLTLEDVLLYVLAENGKHFQSLGANEQLTLAFTFRDRGGEGSARTATAESFLFSTGFVTPSQAAGGGGTPAGTPPNTASGAKVKDHELLADLHIKQGRYQEAIKSLQIALEANKDSSRAGSLYRKLASAYLLQDAGQGNQQLLDKAMDFVRKAQESSKGPAAVQTQRISLPTRLTMTASRTALQSASPGNLDEFRKQISVTWMRFDRPAAQSTVEPEKSSSK